MNFTIEKSIEILERTPIVIEELLHGISDDWSNANEGENTFSPYDVIGHLIHGEKTDWIVRMDIILSGESDKKFQPFDRFAQFNESKGKSLKQLLQEFKVLRQKNIVTLKTKKLTKSDFEKIYDLDKKIFFKLVEVEKENKSGYTFIHKDGQRIPLKELAKTIEKEKKE